MYYQESYLSFFSLSELHIATIPSVSHVIAVRVPSCKDTFPIRARIGVTLATKMQGESR